MFRLNIVLLILFVELVNYVFSQQPCTSSDKLTGNCTTPAQCMTIKEIVPNNFTVQQRLVQSMAQCGINRLCCPIIPVKKGIDLLPKIGVCGIDTADRIVGGTKTKIDEFPWATLIGYMNTKTNATGFFCGGVLISDRYVLTASHCVNQIPPVWKLISVRLGEWDTSTDEDCDDNDGELDCSDPPVDVPVSELFPHPEYDPTSVEQYHDIALLRLGQKVKFTDFIKPICLPTDDTFKTRDYSKDRFSVAGWGKTEFESKSDRKLKVNLPGVPLEICNLSYSDREIITTQLCAGGEEGKDSCRGDSGGALMGRATLLKRPYVYAAGIVSFGPSPCGRSNWPGVYSKVSAYLDWILTTIKA